MNAGDSEYNLVHVEKSSICSSNAVRIAHYPSVPICDMIN